MASWRDSASQQAQADLDELVDAATGFAVSRISLAGEFLPFALAVSIDGQVQAVQPNFPSDSQREIADQLAARWQALSEMKDSLRAVAVAANVTLPEEHRDGIEISFEHQEGIAIGVIVRYTVGTDRVPMLETPSAYQEDTRIWVA